MRQDPQPARGISFNLRTVERALAHLRREAPAQTVDTVRFETAG